MTFIAIVLAGLAVFLSGMGIMGIALPLSSDRTGRGLRLFLGLPIGIGIWSCSYLLPTLAGIHGRAVLLGKDVLLSIVGGVLLARRKRDQIPRASSPRTRDWMPGLPLFLAIMAMLAAAAFAGHSTRLPDGDWDAWAIWNVRARFLFRTPDPRLIFHNALAHTDYPPLLPGLVAQSWMLIGRESTVVPALVGAVLSALTVGLLVCAISHLRGRSPGLLAGIFLLGTPEFVERAADQYADVPISLFLLTSATLMVLSSTAPRRARWLLFLSGMAASLAAWTKNEGLLQTVCLLTAFVLAPPSGPFRKRFGDVALIAAGAAPLLLALAWFKHGISAPNDLVGAISPHVALSRLATPARYGRVVGGLLRRMILVDRWNLFLLALPVVWIICLVKGTIAPAARCLGLALLLMLAGLGGVYVLTSADLPWHISSSMSRLLVQLWPTAILATALAVPPRFSTVEIDGHHV